MPKKFIVMSACRGVDTATDDRNHLALCLALHRLGCAFEEVQGCYKGQTERSVLVYNIQNTIALGLARQFEQESILSVDHERRATLLYPDEQHGYRTEPIGYWTEVQDTAGLDAYTVIGDKIFAVL